LANHQDVAGKPSTSSDCRPGGSMTKQHSSFASSLAKILAKVRVPCNKKYVVWMSFYELYNDNINDLLDSFDPKKNSNNRPSIREDKNKVPFVEGVTHAPVEIFLKLKPLTEAEMVKQGNELLYKLKLETSISVRPPRNSVFAQTEQAKQKLAKTVFHFTKIFQPTITQQEFFTGTIYPCFEKFFNGDSLLIFSYGVSNSEKSNFLYYFFAGSTWF
jgi:hypothetical protein